MTVALRLWSRCDCGLRDCCLGGRHPRRRRRRRVAKGRVRHRPSSLAPTPADAVRVGPGPGESVARVTAPGLQARRRGRCRTRLLAARAALPNSLGAEARCRGAGTAPPPAPKGGRVTRVREIIRR